MKKRFIELPILFIPIWICLGAAIGVPMENISIGVGFGSFIGIGLFLKFQYKNKKNSL